MRGIICAVIGVAVAVSLGALPAAAQSKNELIKSLIPFRAPVTRGIKVEPSKPSNLPTVSVNIEFEHASDRLMPAGQKLLDEVGAALQDPSLKSFRFMIAAHTDSAGTAQFNQQLSERRAATVKAYLVSGSQIEPARLSTVGYGKSRPINPANPMSPENRRIEIINLLN